MASANANSRFHRHNRFFATTGPLWKIVTATSIVDTLRNTSSRQAPAIRRSSAETGFEGLQAPSPGPYQSRINPMEESIMKKFAALLAAFVILAGPLAAASKDEKETDRLGKCCIVLYENNDNPECIPHRPE